MKYFTSGPDNVYFEWQFEVMLTNFKRVGIPLEDCHVIVLDAGCGARYEMYELAGRFPAANFHFYPFDLRCVSYLGSMKPFGMLKFFEANPDFSDPIFYHDSDIIFLEKPNFEHLLADDVWYFSDTISYVGYEYLARFGIRQIAQMAAISGISIETIRLNQQNSGGAQHIMKNLSVDFWRKVVEDSFKIYDLLRKNGTEIQVWCAEMWANLYAALAMGYEVRVVPELDFISSTDLKSKRRDEVILHNNGVQPGSDLFYKGEWLNRRPFGDSGINLVNKAYCSHWYVEAINEVKL